jgi:hypothetical protein
MARASFYSNSYVENANWSIVFNDSPYDILNNVQFDVSNIRADTYVEAGFGGTKCEITFDVAYKNEQEKAKCFTNWFENVYAP